MKKSVKILIVVLCLIIVGLAGFIVWDKIINNKKDNGNTTNTTQNNVVTNSNENVNSANSNNTTKQNNDEAKIANEAIKKALKSRDWLEKHNLYYEIKDGSTTLYKSELYIIKIKDIGGIPTYLVKSHIMDSAHTSIVTYKNGEVYVSKIAAGSDYCDEFVDIENNLVKSVNVSADITNIYIINNGEFEKIAEFETEEESNAKYPKANFKEITIKLTDENLDKYVK